MILGGCLFGSILHKECREAVMGLLMKVSLNNRQLWLGLGAANSPASQSEPTLFSMHESSQLFKVFSLRSVQRDVCNHPGEADWPHQLCPNAWMGAMNPSALLVLTKSY